jgi:hypothetical protein
MSIKVIGLDSAIKALRKKGKDAERAILDELEDTATNIELTAGNLAPKTLGGVDMLNLLQRINKEPSNKGFTWTVGIESQNDFDAYAEFGTGLSAKEILSRPDYTTEIRALAWTFRKNLKGTLKGKPYMFPAYFQHTAQLVQRLKDEVSKAVQ